MRGRFSFNRLFLGLIVIGIGVLFLLKQTGYIAFDLGEFNFSYIISTFWPVILIWIGLNGLFGHRSHGGSGWWGAFMIMLGIVFLGHNLDWFAWSLSEIFANLWPVGVILVGLSMLWKPRSRRHRHDADPPSDEWRSYDRFGDNGDIPPAPPLHPDPTKPMTEEELMEEHRRLLDEEEKLRRPFGEAGDPHEWSHKKWKEHYKQTKEQYKQSKEYYKQQYKQHFKHHHKHYKHEYWDNNPHAQNRSGFIGDIHIGHDYWELKPLNISHFIGDTTLDLTKAQIAPGETKINISSFVGDVKVFVPNDYDIGVQVISSAFVGDVKILGHREGGVFKHVDIHSPSYQEADKKIKLVVSTFIGDVRVTKVG